MKKLVLAVLAIGAMAACTKSNVQYEEPGEISLQPVAQKATKAAVDGTEYPTSINFNVWAWWRNCDANTDLDEFIDPDTDPDDVEPTPYIAKGEFEYKSGTSWGGTTPYYWPTKGSLVFAGYSPADASGTFSYTLGTNTFAVTDYVQSSNIAETKDLMWFDVTDVSHNQNGTSGVPVEFKHALSWLTFKFYLKESTTPEYWTIKSVVLKGIETTADFTASTTNTAWTTPTDAPTEGITVYSNTTGHLVKKTYDTDDDAILENTHNGVLIIPQSCAPSNGTNPADAELVITYDLKSPTGRILTDQNVSLPLNGTSINDNKWNPGKHYIYTITFGANEIRIAPTVEGWTDVPVEVPVP